MLSHADGHHLHQTAFDRGFKFGVGFMRLATRMMIGIQGIFIHQNRDLVPLRQSACTSMEDTNRALAHRIPLPPAGQHGYLPLGGCPPMAIPWPEI